MSDEGEYDFFRPCKEAKTYISRVFAFNDLNAERVRQVKMVIDGSDQLHFGEIEGALCLRLTGNKRKTQVTALVTQDNKQIKRLTLQTFKSYKSRDDERFEGVEKEDFTFRSDEFSRLLDFLAQIDFIDLSNEAKFQIEDISKKAGPKAIIDADDRGVIDRINRMEAGQRSALLRSLQHSLTTDEINILLGRRQGLEEFESHVQLSNWSETQWQNYFEREQWVFGYGLDYRVMRQFSREAVVGAGGSDDRDRPTVDFLMTFTDYTVLVEIKKPDTPLFKASRGGRAGTWEFSSEFMGAVSQILEQKAEWLSFAQTGDHFNKAGTQALAARTRNTKSILVIGSSSEFSRNVSQRDGNVRRDTFELFRRESRSIEIITFDELLERARFITRS